MGVQSVPVDRGAAVGLRVAAQSLREKVRGSGGGAIAVFRGA